MRIRYLARAASMTGFALITALSASAQNQGLVIRDGSLGTGPAGVVGAGTDPIGRGASYLITPNQGKQVGGNLFHSFSQFSIGRGETATFTGPDSVSGPQSVHAIVSRVTGGSVSDIDGRLRSTIPGADVFLLNPAGVMFGPDARLDVKGSFHASTADSLEFDNGEVFEARAGGSVALLQIARPESFGFLDATAGSVTLNGATLETPAGAGLSLVGGAVDAKGATLLAPGGRLHLAAVASPTEVPVVAPPAPLVATSSGGTVTLSSSTVDASDPQGGRGGGVWIEGGVLRIDGSTAHADCYGAEAGSGVSLRASDSVTLVGGSTITSDAHKTATSPPVQIQAPIVDIADGSKVSSDSYGPGSSGGVQVISADSVELRGGSALTSEARSGSSGNGGTISVVAGQLLIDGTGSEVGTVISSQAEPGSAGQAGDVTINAASVTLQGGGYISTSTAGDGDAGTVSVAAGDKLQIEGTGYGVPTGIFSRADFDSGNAGEITVHAGSLTVQGGGEISSSTSTEGNAGTVSVTADDKLLIDGTGLPFPVFTGIRSDADSGTGNGGDITVHAGSLTVRDSGEISSSTIANGDAGTVSVTADELLIDGTGTYFRTPFFRGFPTGIFSDTRFGTGNGGAIMVHARSLTMQGSGDISSSTRGPGDAGTISVTADKLLIDGSASFFLDGTGSPEHFLTGIHGDSGYQLPYGPGGNGGGITVHAGSLTVQGGGDISSSTIANGDAGTVSVTVDDKLLIDGTGSDFDAGLIFTGIRSDAAHGTGNGGGVTVHAGSITLQGYGRIESSTEFGKGDAGTVSVTADREVMIDGVGTPFFFGVLSGPAGFYSTGIFSDTNYSTGNGGDVTLQASSVTVKNWGRISSSTSDGAGEDRDGHRRPCESPSACARGGDVTVIAGDILVAESGAIAAQSTGQGDAGNVSLQGADRIALRDASISTSAEGANGGNITVQAGTLVDLLNSQITANVEGGTGGNITIDPQFVVLDHSTIEAKASTGRGGAIRIVAGNLFESPDSTISASAGDAILSGTVTITSAQTNVVGTLTALPANYVDEAAFIRDRCAARQSTGAAGSFVVRSRDGAPAMPDGLLPAATAGAAPTASGSFESEPRLLFSGSPDLFAASCP